MKTAFLLVCMLLMTNLVLGDPETTEKHEDMCGTVNEAGTAILTRVERKVRVTYPYTLNNAIIWSQFPDLALSFYIPHAQYV